MKDYNQFDGLIHKGGKVYDLDGTEVHQRFDSFVQLDGIEVADRNADDDEKVEIAYLAKQRKAH